MKKKILIVGGVAGGATTATRLRRLSEDLDIVIFERGKYISYANCGLPYYIGNVIKEREDLIIQSKEIMKAKYNVDVRLESEVTSINREAKSITVHNLQEDKTYEENYDVLVLATGSSPLKPPIPGIDSPNILSLWTVPDTDAIKAYIEEKAPKRAAVIGGGFIGVEMAENLHAAGLKVQLIEMMNQVMTPLDFEMAEVIHENMAMNNVELHLGDGVKSFETKDNVTTITLQSGKQVETDLVILAIGVRPNNELAKGAGLSVNEKGGIIVDSKLLTNDPDIYAVGDVIQVENHVTKTPCMIPLAGPANKQARICADNIMGKDEIYRGTQGTAIAQVFDLTAASTGLNEKQLNAMGLKKYEDYQVVLINQKSHAGYYPGATPMVLKLIFHKDGHIYGAQVVGQDGVDKRMDVLSSVMRLNGTIYDLKELELCYAPPFGSAKDPINMLGFVAENILKDMIKFIDASELDKLIEQKEDIIILDAGEEEERTAFAIPGSVHIPLGQLRSRIKELDKTKRIIVYCAIGVRSYNAIRILKGNGFENVCALACGSSLYKTLHFRDFEKEKDDEMSKEHLIPLNDEDVVIVDCAGLQCPGPIIRVNETLKNLPDGTIVKIKATDMGFPRDVQSWCRRTGNTYICGDKEDKQYVSYIKKGTGTTLPITQKVATAAGEDDGKTIIVFSGDLDKVLASFIIANGAASMGRKVTMFFTFWGLNALRKPDGDKVKKPFMEKMFGAMMPKGADKLTLSKMNMAGMGTKMMKMVMNNKNVNSLEELMKQAMASGIHLIACTMSMDIMGITKEELIDGVELGGVATYLGEAEESNVNLFI